MGQENTILITTFIFPVLWKNVIKKKKFEGYKAIIKDLEIPISIVFNVIKMFHSHKTVKTHPGHGTKKKLSERILQRLVQIVENTPHKTSKELQADLEVVSAYTIHCTLNQVGVHGSRPRRTPVLTESHKKAKLMFAKTLIDKPQSF